MNDKKSPGIHAREWISPATATYLAKQLAEKKSALLASWDVYIMPLANPDGYVLIMIVVMQMVMPLVMPLVIMMVIMMVMMLLLMLIVMGLAKKKSALLGCQHLSQSVIMMVMLLNLVMRIVIILMATMVMRMRLRIYFPFSIASGMTAVILNMCIENMIFVFLNLRF